MIIYVLLVNSKSIINMFIRQIYNKKLLLFIQNKNLFSKIRKRTPKKATQSLKQQENKDFSFEDYVEYNYEHFDALESLKKIHKAYTTNLQFNKLQQSKQLYDKMDEQCIQLLRLQNQKLIIKISQGQICYQDLKRLLNIKIWMQLRFRKWDDMVLDIHNQIQAIKYENQDINIAEIMAAESYHKLCAILMMSDHNQLYDLFDYEIKFTPERKRKIRDKSDKIQPFGFGIETYNKIEIEAMKVTNPSLEISEMLLLQGKALLVLGRKEVAIRKLSVLTGLNFNKDIRQQAFISILVSLSFPSKGAKPINQKHFQIIKKAKNITLFEAKQLAESYITVQQGQNILNCLLLHFQKQNIVQLNNVNRYYNILALICQNYYIEEKQSEYIRLSSILRNKQDENLNFMLNYFEIARNIDKNDLDKAETMFKELKNNDQELKDGIRYFYHPEKTIFDLLRVNTCKLGSKIYQLKGDQQKFRQYVQQSHLLECKLGVYTIRQPNPQLLQGNNLTIDWRDTVSGRVPYHYLSLRLEKILCMNELLFEQSTF